MKRWTKYSTPRTTLWFWNTEVGWATVHPLLEQHGWQYRGCNVWNKGVGHVAGNVNTQTIRKFPVVTEVCAQYVLSPKLGSQGLSLQEWMRSEWKRTGLPFHEANVACGVKSAATRKYLTGDALWYPPPADMMARLVAYANRKGAGHGSPYFQLGNSPDVVDMKAEYDKLRSVFRCPFGVTNVWDEPTVRGTERVKVDGKILHTNQKPLRLLTRLVRATTHRHDVVWEPFGGLCTTAIAAFQRNRACYSAEQSLLFYRAARDRLRSL